MWGRAEETKPGEVGGLDWVDVQEPMVGRERKEGYRAQRATADRGCAQAEGAEGGQVA